MQLVGMYTPLFMQTSSALNKTISPQGQFISRYRDFNHNTQCSSAEGVCPVVIEFLGHFKAFSLA